MRLSSLIAGVVCGALSMLVAVRPARAWIFPEHAEITRIALENELPAEARAVLDAAVLLALQSNPHERIALCTQVTMPFARVNRQDPPCVPFSVLPALAGDHSIDEAELRSLLGHQQSERSSLLDATFKLSKLFQEFLNDAPLFVSRVYRGAGSDGDRTDESADSARRTFTRELDLYLEAKDPAYSKRAEGARAHFQDSSAPLEEILRRATAAGDLDNALGQTMAHHLRSLALAVRSRGQSGAEQARSISSALFEHAMALHFVQDAFAAGHIGTEHAIGNRISRLRRHDFLNRAGLQVKRLLATEGCSTPTIDPARSNGPDHCWIAYGDGYLDSTNLEHAAEASARLTVQLTLALDTKLPERLATSCREKSTAVETREITGKLEELEVKVDDLSPQDRPELRRERDYLVHVFKRKFKKSQRIRVTVSSEAFDAYLQVRLHGKESWLGLDQSDLDPDAFVLFKVPEDGEYEINVGSERPGLTGPYQLRIEVLQALDAPSETDCSPLLNTARLLDPAPHWTLTRASKRRQAKWSINDRVARATAIVKGAAAATSELTKRRLPPAAGAGIDSSAQAGTLPSEWVGRPFVPCVREPRWEGRVHPLCDAEGEGYRFGDIDASLVRPLLVAWPGPTGSLRTIRGEDSFGAGLASQVIFGLGLAGGFHERVPLAFSPFSLGGGFAFRADRIFPSRVNREVIGLNAAVFPLLLTGLHDIRYVFTGYTELRIPLVSAAGYVFTRRPWEVSSNVDLGPTGVRLYWALPDRAPERPFELFAWDIEALNIKLKGGSGARTASTGNAMDTELRLRLGISRPRVLDEAFDESKLFTLAVEIASGYSVFLWQVE